jgi:hypothetical protein
MYWCGDIRAKEELEKYFKGEHNASDFFFVRQYSRKHPTRKHYDIKNFEYLVVAGPENFEPLENLLSKKAHSKDHKLDDIGIRVMVGQKVLNEAKFSGIENDYRKEKDKDIDVKDCFVFEIHDRLLFSIYVALEQ